MTRVLSFVLTLLFILPGSSLADPYPLDQWARRAAISNIEISPDGRYLGIDENRGQGSQPHH